MSSQESLSRELALRIGLAARVLPDTDAKRLFTVLSSSVGLPLTTAKMDNLNLNTLKTAQESEFSEIEESLLKQAVHILKHPVNMDNTPAPLIQAYNEGDMPGSVRVACASNDALTIDGHFGSCSQFLVYQVSAIEIRLIALRSTAVPEGLAVEDKNLFRAALIQDCQVLYLASVGGPAAAKIVKLGIHPIKLSGTASLRDVLGQLQTVIAGTPPPWLAKVMGIEAPDRFRFEREATA